jgi:hypothetical protein
MSSAKGRRTVKRAVVKRAASDRAGIAIDHSGDSLENLPPRWGQIAPRSSKKRGQNAPSRKFLKTPKSVLLTARMSWADQMCSILHPCAECCQKARLLGVQDVASLAVRPSLRPRLVTVQVVCSPALSVVCG